MSLEVLGRASLGQVEWTPEVFDDNSSKVSQHVENTNASFVGKLGVFQINIISIMIAKSGPWWVQYFGEFVCEDITVR